MATLIGKIGSWELDHVHTWKERGRTFLAPKRPIITSSTRIATIGSCFAAELAAASRRLGLQGDIHPGGLFYNTTTIRQEFQRVFSGGNMLTEEPPWQVRHGLVDPFNDYHRVFASQEELSAAREQIWAKAATLFRDADVIVITLGLIEAWRNPKTNVYYRAIPHPAVFENLTPEFHRLTVDEMLDDLRLIRSAVRDRSEAEIVLTVSPIPLQATVTNLDVRVADMESKSRIRAAVSQFVEEYPDVLYFHSFEIVRCAERMSDFMLQDGRHVARHGVDYIVAEFLRTFADNSVAVPTQDLSWLAAPTKTAHRPGSSVGGWLSGRLSRVRQLGRRVTNAARSVFP